MDSQPQKSARVIFLAARKVKRSFTALLFVSRIAAAMHCSRTPGTDIHSRIVDSILQFVGHIHFGFGLCPQWRWWWRWRWRWRAVLAHFAKLERSAEQQLCADLEFGLKRCPEVIFDSC